MASARLSKSQQQVMNWLSRGWKAYAVPGGRVEVNGMKVGTLATMESLEKLGLIERLGVSAWTATQSGRAADPAPGGAG